jgi:GNAT superfamily N-acetyltransferase
MIIREANKLDANAIAHIHVDGIKSSYSGLIPDEYLDKQSYDRRADRWLALLNQEERPDYVYIAYDTKGGVVGFVHAGPERGGYKNFRGEFYDVFLTPRYQRRGIGRQLIKTAANRFLNNRIYSVVGWVPVKNRNRTFYEALGGKELEQRVISVGDCKLVEIAYGWEDVSLVT